MTENPTGSGGAPTAPHPDDSGPRVTRDEVRDLSRLRRSSTDKHIAGVAGGLGRHLDIDPVILRVAFVVFAFFGGAGLLVYGACWLLVPADNELEAKIDLDPRNRNAALIGVLLLGALLTLSEMVGGNGWEGFWFPFPLLVVGGIAWLVLSRRDRKRQRYAVAYGPAAYGQPAYGPTSYGPPVPPPGTPGQEAQGPATYAAPGTPAYGQSMTGWATTPPSPPAPPAPPVYYAAPVPPVPPAPRPRDPRKRGPILFWFTLALVALGIGVLGTLDLAGLDVTDSAYPALALGLVATMLLVGAFYGRAGGLILLGFLAAIGVLGGTLSENWDGETVSYTPATAAAVQSTYAFDAGDLTLDLRDVTDLSALDGRTIDLEGNVGHLEVIVPPGLDVTANAHINGPGGIELFGEDSGGIDISAGKEFDGGHAVPHLTINTTLDVGDIEVRR